MVDALSLALSILALAPALSISACLFALIFFLEN
jgi:hypothetical protein